MTTSPSSGKAGADQPPRPTLTDLFGQSAKTRTRRSLPSSRLLAKRLQTVEAPKPKPEPRPRFKKPTTWTSASPPR